MLQVRKWQRENRRELRKTLRRIKWCQDNGRLCYQAPTLLRDYTIFCLRSMNYRIEQHTGTMGEQWNTVCWEKRQ